MLPNSSKAFFFLLLLAFMACAIKIYNYWKDSREVGEKPSPFYAFVELLF